MNARKPLSKLQKVRALAVVTAIADLGVLSLMFNPFGYANGSYSYFLFFQRVGAVCGIFIVIMAMYAVGTLVLGKAQDEALRRGWALVLATCVLPLALFFLISFWSILSTPYGLGSGQG
jgi:uncharacterized membrane protein